MTTYEMFIDVAKYEPDYSAIQLFSFQEEILSSFCLPPPLVASDVCFASREMMQTTHDKMLAEQLRRLTDHWAVLEGLMVSEMIEDSFGVSSSDVSYPYLTNYIREKKREPHPFDIARWADDGGVCEQED